MTSNEDLFDATVRHQIGLLRVSGGVRNRVLNQLDAVEADIKVELMKQLEKGVSLKSDRLNKMLVSIKEIRGTAWDEATQTWNNEMIGVAKAEPAFMGRIAQTVAPVTFDVVLPSVAVLTDIVRSSPFEGATLKTWAGTLRKQDLDKIEQQIKIGIVQGESNQNIARRLFGTQVARGADGITALTRKHASAITRTATNHVANQARRAFATANTDIFSKEQYVATLDSRTTAVCRGFDGKTFPVGSGPIPPLHWNCRSLRIPVLDSGEMGERPARNSTEQLLKREGITTRAARRARIRELTGTVSSGTTYNDFLKRQPVAVQNDILGTTKAKLWRDGGLELPKFVDRTGSELTLSQLARAEKEAFKSAGLDPENFL